VVPTIDFERQYATNAVDLRLGNSFITSKLTEFTHIPTKPSENPLSDKNIEYFFEKHFIPFNKNFTLHPHSFVLAVTMEYICIPADHYALVLGRSTWGRLGLNIATATAVGPGFKGCITLELRNLSEVPITLNVGTRICQICLIKNPEEKGKLAYYLNNNKYICPTEAEYPKIDQDPDWEILRKYNKA
jgi:dCTP deaminase